MLFRLHHDAAYKYENSISEPNFTFGNPIPTFLVFTFYPYKTWEKNRINNTI